MEIVDQLSRPALLAELKQIIPGRYDTPGMDPLPNCVQVDFAITPAPGGGLEGKVVELQAFPSGYAMMTVFADAWDAELKTQPGLEGDWTCCVLPRAEAMALMRDTILGGERPEHVALVDFEPHQQKTVPDFVATEKLFGVESACATELVKEGRKLFRHKDGKLIPLRRIYNRMVFDELETEGVPAAVRVEREARRHLVQPPQLVLAMEQVLTAVPRAPRRCPRRRSSRISKTLPADLSRYVLKPLFSFAGAGVVIDVTPEDIARVPAEQRHGWVLQKKIVYAPAIHAPDGTEVKAEVRVMLLRPPEAPKLRPAIHLVRLSRGKMLGVDQNRGLTWVGASVGLWRADSLAVAR